jgi:hypothetical protein
VGLKWGLLQELPKLPGFAKIAKIARIAKIAGIENRLVIAVSANPVLDENQGVGVTPGLNPGNFGNFLTDQSLPPWIWLAAAEAE